MMRRSQMRRAGIAALAATLALAACGGEAEDPTDSEAETTEDDQEAADPEGSGDESGPIDYDLSSIEPLQWGAGGEGSVNAEAALASGQVLRAAGLELYTVNTGGTIDGLISVADGELDLANADNQTLAEVWNAEGEDQLRGYAQVMSGFSTFFYIVTRPDSGIETLADLEGRSLNGHTPGAILNVFTDTLAQVLADAGIVAEGSIELQQNPMSDTLDNMLSGTTDAQVGYSFAGDIPGWLAQAEARNIDLNSIMIPVEIHDGLEANGFVVVDDPAVDRFRDLDPSIPEGEPFYTSGIFTIMVASDDVPAEAIFALLSEWDRHKEELADAHPANAVYLDSDYMSQFLLDGIPVHPGAERYFAEN